MRQYLSPLSYILFRFNGNIYRCFSVYIQWHFSQFYSLSAAIFTAALASCYCDIGIWHTEAITRSTNQPTTSLNYSEILVNVTVCKTEDHHLTGIALSDTNKRCTIGKVSPNALQICTHFRSSYSVRRVIRQKVSHSPPLQTFHCQK